MWYSFFCPLENISSKYNNKKNYHISSKYEEICAPQVEEFCYITDNTYFKEEVGSYTALAELCFFLYNSCIIAILPKQHEH